MTRVKKIAIASAVLLTPAVAWAAAEAPGLCDSICSLFGCC